MGCEPRRAAVWLQLLMSWLFPFFITPFVRLSAWFLLLLSGVVKPSRTGRKDCCPFFGF